MGRAYAVREAKIKKTGAQKGKLYTNFAKELYLAAKRGVPEIESNLELKRLVEKAKKMQVPSDIIDRAINKAKGNGGEDYKEVLYEGFGPGSSTLIIKALTDNVNRTVGEVRAAFNKVHKSLGVQNSVTYNYDNLSLIGIKSNEYDKLFEALLDEGIEIVDLEQDEDLLVVSCKPSDNNSVKDVIDKMFNNPEYEVDETGWFPKDKTELTGEDLEVFNKLYKMLDEVEDVQEIYTNVNMN